MHKFVLHGLLAASLGLSNGIVPLRSAEPIPLPGGHGAACPAGPSRSMPTPLFPGAATAPPGSILALPAPVFPGPAAVAPGEGIVPPSAAPPGIDVEAPGVVESVYPGGPDFFYRNYSPSEYRRYRPPSQEQRQEAPQRGPIVADVPCWLGKADFLNRYNIFNNMNALPQNRLWGGWQYLDRYDTGNLTTPLCNSSVLPQDRPAASCAPRHVLLNVYRVGAEVELTNRCSVAFQTGYLEFPGDTKWGDSWTNPYILLKYALLRGNTGVVSVVCGYQPETSLGMDDNQVREDRSRVSPGMLAQQVLGPVFVEGGFEFGCPFGGNDTYTCEYGLGLGVWVFQAPGWNDPDRTGRSLLLGWVGQVEVFGQEVLGSSWIKNAYGDSPTIDTQTGAVLSNPARNPRHVYGLTVGTQVFFNICSIGVGYNTPMTGGQSSRNQVLTNIQFRF